VGTATIAAVHAGSGVTGDTVLSVFDEIVLQSVSAAGRGSGLLSLTVSTPANTEAGDVLLAAVAIRPHTAAVTPPAGWTLLRRQDNGATNANSLLVYWRVAAVGEPVGHTWTLSTSTGSAGGIASFRFVDSANPIDVEAAQVTAAGLLHAAPSVTSTGANGRLVTMHCFSSSATWSPPAGMTEAFEVASGSLGSGGVSVSMHHLSWPAAGATGSRTATASNDADVGNGAVVVLRRRS
jgi:hypothetical protein